MKKIKLLWLLVCLLSNTVLAQPEGLRVTLSPLQQSYQAADSLYVQFSLSNTSDRAIRILKWGTPFENSFNVNMFEVMFGNEPVTYIGRLTKRRLPSDGNYLKLLPGESLSTRIDLSLGYDFSRAGHYIVRYRDKLLKTTRQAFISQGKVQTQSHSESIILNLVEDRPQKIGLAASVESFSACSAQQQSTILEALISAQAIARASFQSLTNTSAEARVSANRYINWFGTYQGSRYDTVISHFDGISASLEDEELDFDCSCNEDYYAYIIPSVPNKIFLCNAFWPAPLTGTDSRAGVLVHEVSHFRDVADTLDSAYGQTACEALAVSNPDKAIRNADSHEYFAENTPFLSMASFTGVNPAPWLLLLLD